MKPFVCRVCGDDYRKLRTLQAHQRTVGRHEREAKPFIREISGNGYDLFRGSSRTPEKNTACSDTSDIELLS